jgi:mono/diheme cytochrome c family protein
MAPEIDPIEKKKYGKIFFVVGGFFFLVSLWAFYNEFISRRSWIDFQNEFNTLELKKIKTEYDKAKNDLDAEDARREQIPEGTAKESELSLRRVRLKAEQAQIRMEEDAFKNADKELGLRKIKLADAKQKFGFTKADEDEIYYQWKLALEEGNADNAAKYKKKYYEHEDLLKELKKKVDEAQAGVDEVQKTLDVYYTELKKWQGMEKKQYDILAKLEKKRKAVEARSLDIRQAVVDDLGKGGPVKWGAVDRCESCHVAINRDGFENEKEPFRTHPFRAEIFGNHPIDQYGCTTCHGGQGRATQISGKPFEDGDFVHGYVKHWPDPVLKGDWMQANCNKCHQDQWKLDHAPVYMEGKKAFWDLGCTGCHLIKGFENAPRVGPSLRKEHSKVFDEWLMAWIKNPKGYLPHTKMPQPPLDIEEPGQTEKVAAYIVQNSEPYDFPFGKYPGGNVEAGKKVFEAYGCLGCHTMEDRGTGLAPALDKIASKTTADWIYNWIQDPKSYSAEARMPDLRLTPQEAANVTAYLIQHGEKPAVDETLEAKLNDPENAKKGFLIISQYGCYGCHNIKGFENMSKLSVELTPFGKKEVTELDFGDTKVPRTWADWTFGKIKDPRMYLTEKTSSKMPNFGLSDEQIHSLVVFLKGMKKDDVPDKYIETKVRPHQQEIDNGRRMVERLNCKGCHMIEGEGRLIEKVIGPDKSPPVLDGIGARVRPDWMFMFLKDPGRIKIRPWIDVHMPTFGFSDQDTNAVIQYFSALSKVSPSFSTVHEKAPSPEMLAAGAKLASKDYFSCFSCHIQNGKTPTSSPEQWGPDLALAHQRIRYDFIPGWVEDPQSYTPGVKMPAFLPTDDSAAPDVLGADRQKQADALRDFVMSLGK